MNLLNVAIGKSPRCLSTVHLLSDPFHCAIVSAYYDLVSSRRTRQDSGFEICEMRLVCGLMFPTVAENDESSNAGYIFRG